MMRPRLRIPRVRVPRQSAQRSIHQVPLLGNGWSEKGVNPLLSKGGFDMAWTQTMEHMIEKLNQLTSGTELYDKPIKDVIMSTAREPHLAPIFNYASYAHNNEMFFRSLKAHPEEADPDALPDRASTEMPPDLRKEIVDQFSSIETLRRELVLTANAMFGPGFVWLVKNAQSRDYRVLTTYLAGSPYSGAHWRRQPVDMSALPGADRGNSAVVSEYLNRQALGAGQGGGAGWHTAPGGIDVVPLLCVNTWDRAFLRDYGIGFQGVAGKRAYLETWWNCIDWEIVASRAEVQRRQLRH